MCDASYYSLIERTEDGSFVAWVPDLPGTTATGATEDEVIRQIFRSTRQRLRDMIINGDPIPRARPLDELPRRNGRSAFRRLLLIIG